MQTETKSTKPKQDKANLFKSLGLAVGGLLLLGFGVFCLTNALAIVAGISIALAFKVVLLLGLAQAFVGASALVTTSGLVTSWETKNVNSRTTT